MGIRKDLTALSASIDTIVKSIEGKADRDAEKRKKLEGTLKKLEESLKKAQTAFAKVEAAAKNLDPPDGDEIRKLIAASQAFDGVDAAADAVAKAADAAAKS